jgi:multidrug resistance efflux pump
VGASVAECEKWLDEYVGQASVAKHEAAEHERIQAGITAQQKVNSAQSALQQAEAELAHVRSAQGLPPVDWDDPALDTNGNPLIATTKRLRDEFHDVKTKFGYQAELSRLGGHTLTLARNSEIRRDMVASAVAAVRDSMRHHQATIENTQRLESQLDSLRRQIEENKQREHATHQNIIKMHTEYWRVTGRLLTDYSIPPKPEHTGDSC